MDIVKTRIEDIEKIVQAITETARDVNRHSHTRKKITSEGQQLMRRVLDGNASLHEKYDRIYMNFQESRGAIIHNAEILSGNVGFFTDTIENIDKIKTTLNMLEGEIDKLTIIVEDIRNDTDEIFTLALNASIVSSKYSHTSGVFDILANKLNEMSNFINQNLENIVEVVKPITDGIVRLIANNAQVLEDTQGGYDSFSGFSEILDKQRLSVEELMEKTAESGTRIEGQKDMIEDLKGKIIQMDQDADGAITGSGNVAATGEKLSNMATQVSKLFEKGDNFRPRITEMQGQARIIWQTAQNVNEKSRSQLEFSQSSVAFCDTLVEESSELEKTTEILNLQAAENNTIAGHLSGNLEHLRDQLTEIDRKLSESNTTMQKFNTDYAEIDNIVSFLKNILNSMNVIGMMSRIESARDPEEFQQFMTISENIRELQNHIHHNIPNIEANIESTHELINNVNSYFEAISQKFSNITGSGALIIEKLREIIDVSSESQVLSQQIQDESKTLVNNVADIRKSLMELSEIVKKPIEGSAANIDRGNRVEELCGLIIYDEEKIP